MSEIYRITPKIFCPKCNSEDLQFVEHNFDNDELYVEFVKECYDCKFQWIELFRFSETIIN